MKDTYFIKKKLISESMFICQILSIISVDKNNKNTIITSMKINIYLCKEMFHDRFIPARVTTGSKPYIKFIVLNKNFWAIILLFGPLFNKQLNYQRLVTVLIATYVQM